MPTNQALDYFTIELKVEENFLEEEENLSVTFETYPNWDLIQYTANKKYLRFDIEVLPCKSLSLEVT